jgi:hypothetical protein
VTQENQKNQEHGRVLGCLNIFLFSWEGQRNTTIYIPFREASASCMLGCKSVCLFIVCSQTAQADQESPSKLEMKAKLVPGITIQHLQEELVRLRFQTQSQEGIPSSAT